MTNEKEIVNRIVDVECGRDDNGFATCSPSALRSSINAAIATVRKEEREAAFKDAIQWARKVHAVKVHAARDAQTQGEFAAIRLCHEADGVQRVIDTLEAALTEKREKRNA